MNFVSSPMIVSFIDGGVLSPRLSHCVLATINAMTKLPNFLSGLIKSTLTNLFFLTQRQDRLELFNLVAHEARLFAVAHRHDIAAAILVLDFLRTLKTQLIIGLLKHNKMSKLP